ncbi:MAG: hypothetical protein O3C68_06795 [Proteobacteria bacterium]|nr:hypothetical protein [Pseudomonadota bacterium]
MGDEAPILTSRAAHGARLLERNKYFSPLGLQKIEIALERRNANKY